MNFPISKLAMISTALILTSCGNKDSSTTTETPDSTEIGTRDHNYFNQIYARCSINNKTNDCNCVARINVAHRATAYKTYKAAYEDIHKPALEHEIETLASTIEEKTKNASDERVLESLEENLDRLRQQLANGIDDIDYFEPPFLPLGATAACITTQ